MNVNLATVVTAEVEATKAGVTDDMQQAELDRVTDHLANHGGAALAKAGHPIHLTASCFVFDETLEETLLTFHRKGQFWVQLGGHLEEDDLSLREAAIREFREESGISTAAWFSALPLDTNIHDVSSAFGTCRTHIDLAFGAVVPRGATTSVSAESDDLGWHSVLRLPSGSVTGLAARAARIRDQVPSLSGT